MNGLPTLPAGVERSESDYAPAASGHERKRADREQVSRFEASLYGRDSLRREPVTEQAPVGNGADTTKAADASRTRDESRNVSPSPQASASVAWQRDVVEPAAPTGAPAERTVSELITQLCNALYVESTHAPGRIVLGFDDVLPIATAEFIRDGARLRLRLLARDRHGTSLLRANAAHLSDELNRTSQRDVQIEIADAP